MHYVEVIGVRDFGKQFVDQLFNRGHQRLDVFMHETLYNQFSKACMNWWILTLHGWIVDAENFIALCCISQYTHHKLTTAKVIGNTWLT